MPNTSLQYLLSPNHGSGYDRIPWIRVPIGLFVRQKGFEGYLRVRARFQVGKRIWAGFPSIMVGGRRSDNNFAGDNAVRGGLRNSIAHCRGRLGRAMIIDQSSEQGEEG